MGAKLVGAEAAIEARALRKIYRGAAGRPENEALSGVDLRVPVGSIFGLLGPNGAGKSTFINILAGLVLKTSGSVRIWGFDQDANPRMSRASIGVVPQELNIDPYLTPADALDVQAGLYGVPPEARRTGELLEAVGLSDKADAYARTLSGGMRRRLLVAKAMAHHPPVLVLDEPTAGVDVELRRQLWDYVRLLNNRGVTIILTTHYLEEAEEMCDRIAIIHHGALRAEAPTPELLGLLDRKTVVVRPTAPLADDPTALAEAVEALRKANRETVCEGVAVSMRPDGRIALRYARRAAPFDAVLEGVRRAGIEIADLSTEDPNLEDVFLELTSAAEDATALDAPTPAAS